MFIRFHFFLFWNYYHKQQELTSAEYSGKITLFFIVGRFGRVPETLMQLVTGTQLYTEYSKRPSTGSKTGGP
jgi:hypothetical protein